MRAGTGMSRIGPEQSVEEFFVVLNGVDCIVDGLVCFVAAGKVDWGAPRPSSDAEKWII